MRTINAITMRFASLALDVFVYLSMVSLVLRIINH